MPLTAAYRCQICGDVLFHDELFSDPSQHFCLTVNGPGMIDTHADDCDIVGLIAASQVKLSLTLLDQIKTSVSKPTSAPAPHTKTHSRTCADSECLNECESEASYVTV
jgi:hypothetical protein